MCAVKVIIFLGSQMENIVVDIKAFNELAWSNEMFTIVHTHIYNIHICMDR